MRNAKITPLEMISAARRPARISCRERRRMTENAVARANELGTAGNRLFKLLLSALAQQGGTITITQSTIDTFGPTLDNSDFKIVDNAPEAGGGFVLELFKRATEEV